MSRSAPKRATRPWLAVGAAAALALGPVSGWAQQQDAGVTAAVNPQATGTPPAELPHVLEIGGNVVQNEHITTGGEGQAQLLFRDGSTMTLGPNGDLTIDNFVYDPEAKTAKLAMTAATGVFRFVGGRASKDEPVIIKTPTATIGIRGGIGVFEVGNGTEASLLYGKQMSATSTSTGEQSTLTKPGFTISIKPNQTITTSRIDQGHLAAVVNDLKGHSGATGGATTTPNQNSQQAQTIATGNSSQPPTSFITSSFTPSLSLSQTQSFTTQLVSTTSQTAAIGTIITTGGVPMLPSGTYVGGLLSPLANSNNINGGNGGNMPLSLGGASFAPITYTETFSDGSSQTITRGSNNSVTFLNGIPQSFSTGESFNQTSPNFGNASEMDGIAASIRNAQVVELGGDLYVQVGRLIGPAAASFSSFQSFSGPGSPPNTSNGPFSATLSPGLSAPYVIGVPATSVPTVFGGPITYSLIAATSPVFANGSGAPGSFSGTLSFAFGQNPLPILQQMDSFPGGPTITSATANLHGFAVGFSGMIVMPGDATYQLSTIGGLSNPGAQIAALMSANGAAVGGTIVGINEFGATFKGSPQVVVQGLSRACPSGVTCSAALVGALAGPGGTRAGILYVVGNFTNTNGTYNLSQLIIGSAAFRH